MFHRRKAIPSLLMEYIIKGINVTFRIIITIFIVIIFIIIIIIIISKKIKYFHPKLYNFLNKIYIHFL